MGSCLSSDGGLSSPAMPSSPAKKGRRGSRKRGPAAASRSNSRREEQLHRIPGRMFLNDSSAVASLFSQQGKKGINQDAMVVWENFGSRMDTVFCGVFDGHGPQGHMVARRVRDSLPLKLSAQFEVNTGIDVARQKIAGIMSSDETGSLSLNEELGVAPGTGERDPDIFPALKESFLKAFKVMDKELKMNQNINCFCSGTTAVTLIKQGQDLVIGNVGDSRAILGTRDQNNHLVAIQLTVDLKPNLPREAERIRRCKGRVFALQDEPQVARVWLPHNDSPGLAMARAFGDFCLKEFGLISVPEISYRRLTEKDEFLVLATDGVWDVLSNKEVVDIVSSAPGQSSAARSLVESAVKAWKRKYPTSRIDDCAAVCLFLNSDAPANCTALKNRELDGSLSSAETSNGNHSITSKPFSDIDTDRGKEASEELPPRLTLHGQPPDGNGDVGEWSALDGVSRVDTLLTLPRFATEERLQDGNT